MNVAPKKKRLLKVFIAVYLLFVVAWLVGQAFPTMRGTAKVYRLGPEIEGSHLAEAFTVTTFSGRILEERVAKALEKAGVGTVRIEATEEPVRIPNALGKRIESLVLPKGTHVNEELWNLVLAAERAGRPDAEVVVTGTGNIIGFSLDLVLVMINFAGLLCILYVFLWDPILEMLDKRAEKIRTHLDSAAGKRKEAGALRDKYAGLMEGAKREREELVQGGQREGEAERQKTIRRAHEEAQTIIHQAREEIEAEVAQARRALRREVASLSAEIAAEILRRELNPEDHEALVQDFLKKVAAGGDEPPANEKTD